MKRVALGAALALAGCGGGGESERSTPRAGAQVYADEGCGGCHVLAAAGSTGAVGPSLDARAIPAAEVERWVSEGGEGMPALGSRLSAAELAALGRYVARESAAARP